MFNKGVNKRWCGERGCGGSKCFRNSGPEGEGAAEEGQPGGHLGMGTICSPETLNQHSIQQQAPFIRSNTPVRGAHAEAMRKRVPK